MEQGSTRHSVNSVAFQSIVIFLAATEGAIFASVYYGRYWLAVPLVLLASHLMHGLLIGFHEASHGLLRRSRGLNEFDGLLIGLLSLTSFSLYRAAHQTHHMHLATERDEELWPFVRTDIPRSLRVVAAILELTFGLFFTPFIFLRTFVRRNSPIRSRKVRRRIWLELIGMAAFWTVAVACVARWHLWAYFLWVYFLPAWLAANLQSWRKYIEHVGMTGSTVNSSTRNVVPRTWLGRVVSYSLLHEPYHGVHHRHAGVPHGALPDYVSVLDPERVEELPPFPSYAAALRHLLFSLRDPKVGAHWLAQEGR